MNKNGNISSLVHITAGQDAKQKGRNGGIKSGKVRRQKASIKKAFKTLAGCPCQDGEINEILRRAGLPENECTISAALALSMIQKAMDGNAQMMRLCLTMLGEEPNLELRERTQEWREKALVPTEDGETCINVSLHDL